MAEGQNLQRLMNPWALHLQKLGLELKCPLWYAEIFPAVLFMISLFQCMNFFFFYNFFGRL